MHVFSETTVAVIALGALMGGIVGSFFATLAVRWPDGRSIVVGRSACDECGAGLALWELVPLVSFVVLRGRCRRCTGVIDGLHPTLEGAGAVIGAAALAASPGWAGVAGGLFGWMLVVLAALDFRNLWLPDRLTLPLLGLGLLGGAWGLTPSLRDRFIGATIAYFLLAGLAALYARLRGRAGIGGGDPKLFAAIGAWLGWQPLPLVLLLSSLTALVAAAVLRLSGRSIDRNSAMPFGAFLALAAWPIWLIETLGA